MEDGAELTHAHEGGRKIRASKDSFSVAQKLEEETCVTDEADVADKCVAQAAPEFLHFKLKRKDTGHNVLA